MAQIDRLVVPRPALVLLVGPSGSGKSVFARTHFSATEVVSSDALREMVSDDAADQGASAEAFRLLALIANGRLRRRLTTVVDATNLRAVNRRGLSRVASRYGIPTIAVAFDLALDVYLERNARRPDRVVDSEVVADQAARMVEVVGNLADEGYVALCVIRDADLLDGLIVERD